jgi:hypothetical protein
MKKLATTFMVTVTLLILFASNASASSEVRPTSTDDVVQTQYFADPGTGGGGGGG